MFCFCHFIYHDGVSATRGMRINEAIFGLRILIFEEHHASAGSHRKGRLGSALFAFWGKKGIGSYQAVGEHSGADFCTACFLADGTSRRQGFRVTSGKLSSSSSRSPCTLTGPQVLHRRGRGASVDKIKHQYTAFSAPFCTSLFLEDDGGRLDVTWSLMYIVALACCVAPSHASLSPHTSSVYTNFSRRRG